MTMLPPMQSFAPRRRWWVSGLALIGWMLFSMAAGASGAIWPVSSWYFEIARPSWTPPPWVFGPVWTLLYLLIGASAWRVWRRGGFRRDGVALGLFLVQWAFNFAWTGLFFGLKMPGVALVEIVVLLALITATIVRFGRHDPFAAIMLVPYLLWVGYATSLNAGFWWLNR